MNMALPSKPDLSVSYICLFVTNLSILYLDG